LAIYFCSCGACLAVDMIHGSRLKPGYSTSLGLEKEGSGTGLCRSHLASHGATIKYRLCFEVLRGEFLENFGMTLGDLEQSFRRSRRFTPALLPVLQGTNGDPKQCSECRLRQPGSKPCPCHLGDNRLVRAATDSSLHFSHRNEQLGPDIPLRIACAQFTFGLRYFRFPP